MKIKGYIPDFKLAFEHFCIHTGGRGVIEEIEKQLQLAPDSVQPSKDTLFRYGNTSSSSIWSVFAFLQLLFKLRLAFLKITPCYKCWSWLSAHMQANGKGLWCGLFACACGWTTVLSAVCELL